MDPGGLREEPEEVLLEFSQGRAPGFCSVRLFLHPIISDDLPSPHHLCVGVSVFLVPE